MGLWEPDCSHNRCPNLGDRTDTAVQLADLSCSRAMTTKHPKKGRTPCSDHRQGREGDQRDQFLNPRSAKTESCQSERNKPHCTSLNRGSGVPLCGLQVVKKYFL